MCGCMDVCVCVCMYICMYVCKHIVFGCGVVLEEAKKTAIGGVMCVCV